MLKTTYLIEKDLWDSKCENQGGICCMPGLTHFDLVFPVYTH